MWWRLVETVKPPIGIAVNTKIDDKNGVRCEQKLIYKDNLWWCTDMRSYVYYKPTHWSYCD